MANDTISALGAGSGVDVKALAQSLVDAEKTPRKAALDDKIKKTESSISGISAIKFVMSELQTAFAALKDQSDFNVITTRVSDPSALSVTTGPNTPAGTHAITVNSLATAQRSISGSDLTGGFSALDSSINGGVAFTLKLNSGSFSAPTKVFNSGATASSTATVSFNALQPGQAVTVNGLTFTASSNMTASEVASAFQSIPSGTSAITAAANNPVSASLGTYSGTFTSGYSSATPTGVGQDQVVLTSNSLGAANIASPSGTPTAPTSIFVSGATQPSTSTLTFTPLIAGQSVSANGLTFTAKSALTASQVAEAFAGIANTGVAASTVSAAKPVSASLGTYSGTFETGYSSGVNANGTLIFTSSSNGAADIAAPTSFANIAIDGDYTSPAGVVASINTANLGITAQLINTGHASAPYRIMVTGQTGTKNSFSLTPSTAIAGLTFSNVQTAGNASLTVDGVPIFSSTNKVQDVIAGTTLELFNTTTNARLDFLRDTSAVKAKITDLVTKYNDANTMLGVVSDPKSTVETYGATLVGNSLVNTVRTQLRALVTTDSTSKSGGLSALRDIGLSITRTGELELNASKLDSALQRKFEHVVTMLSANRENQSELSVLSRGTAGDAVKKINALIGNTGVLSTQSTNFTAKVTTYKQDLEKLDARMTMLLTRYNKQFGAMESLVGQSKSMKDSLKSSFEGMMSVYTNK
jgi:flagellar hook-associated protein 2